MFDNFDLLHDELIEFLQHTMADQDTLTDAETMLEQWRTKYKVILIPEEVND